MEIRDLPGEFWSKVDKSGDCWTWKGTILHTGYGQFHVGYIGGKRVRISAHRCAWELTNGLIPDGLLVCHHCDNPPCCNPAHLFLGTPLDNTRDMISKGRLVPPIAKGTHCGRGHEFTPENTLISKRGYRQCRACRREYMREHPEKYEIYKQRHSEKMKRIRAAAGKKPRATIPRPRPAPRPKNHCARGHEYTPENTFLWLGGRRCRICRHALRSRHASKEREQRTLRYPENKNRINERRRHLRAEARAQAAN